MSSTRRAPGLDWTLTPSAVALIAANLIPLYGVFALGWEVFPLVLLFWLENVVVGGFNVLRILCARPSDPLGWIGKAFLIPFFTFHYGMFTFVHGVFVFALFGGAQGSGSFPLTTANVLNALARYHLIWAALALVASHGFSFVTNYLGRGEYRTASPQALMGQPYARVVVLHLAIIGGGFLLMSLGSPTPGLVLLVLLKIAFDLGAHAREHGKGLRASTLEAVAR
jgi:hypothetical protein